MNSTTTLSTSPTSYGVGTLVGIWTGLCFSVISCGVVGWKACIDYSPLRVSSFVVGLVSCIGLSVVNYLRLDSYIPETVFHVYKVVSMLLFNNLIMVVTFWVAARLYEPGPMPKNRLYKFSISMVVLMNIMAGASLIFGQGLQLTNVGTDMYTGAAVVALTAGTAIFVYAFYPVFRLKGMNEKPSSAMPIGVWYLTGVAILFILGLIPNGIAMAYPLETHRAIELNLTTATIFLRMVFLDFYSFPPPKAAIKAIRRYITPFSLRTLISGSGSSGGGDLEMNNQERIGSSSDEDNASTIKLTSPK